VGTVQRKRVKCKVEGSVRGKKLVGISEEGVKRC